MQLLTNIDPRDDLDKSDRWELVAACRLNGIEVEHDAPAFITKRALRSRGISKIKHVDRPLGLYTSASTSDGGQIHDADEALIKQYEAQKKEETDISKMPMTQLRTACKTKGIKMERRDNLVTLREKLTAHG